MTRNQIIEHVEANYPYKFYKIAGNTVSFKSLVKDTHMPVFGLNYVSGGYNTVEDVDAAFKDFLASATSDDLKGADITRWTN